MCVFGGKDFRSLERLRKSVVKRAHDRLLASVVRWWPSSPSPLKIPSPIHIPKSAIQNPMIAPTHNTLVRRITDKVEGGERLTFAEGVFLDKYVDVLTLGRLANLVRERKNGNLAFYNTNIHLNPTNVCV